MGSASRPAGMSLMDIGHRSGPCLPGVVCALGVLHAGPGASGLPRGPLLRAPAQRGPGTLPGAWVCEAVLTVLSRPTQPGKGRNRNRNQRAGRERAPVAGWGGEQPRRSLPDAPCRPLLLLRPRGLRNAASLRSLMEAPVIKVLSEGTGRRTGWPGLFVPKNPACAALSGGWKTQPALGLE